MSPPRCRRWKQTVRPRGPLTWLDPGAFGTLGVGAGFALGAKLVYPEAEVWALFGDGALGYSLAEFDTFARHGIAVIAVVGNDAGWGLERELQGEMCGSTVACELRPTRYDLVMKGFGGEGENITALSEVGPAVARALAARKPYLLNVNVRGARSPFTQWQLAGKAPKKS